MIEIFFGIDPLKSHKRSINSDISSDGHNLAMNILIGYEPHRDWRGRLNLRAVLESVTNEGLFSSRIAGLKNFLIDIVLILIYLFLQIIVAKWLTISKERMT
jgi:hypothetical protein